VDSAAGQSSPERAPTETCEKTVATRLSPTFPGARFAPAEVAAQIVDAAEGAGLE
jgi:hypothetical protein